MTVPAHDDEASSSINAGCAAHILLVEDDSALSLVLVQTLETQCPAFEVITASSVEQAFGALEDHAIALIITDIHLPGVEGIAFIRRIRERGWHGPVIVMTGDGVEALAETRGLLQISAVLAKPFDMTALVAATDAALNTITAKRAEERGAYETDS